uniref:Uncharacterized protein n=1 Tax=Zooxanthella nutricula TaxID=1333877 RepID=A0A7S2QMD9_9DINO
MEMNLAEWRIALLACKPSAWTWLWRCGAGIEGGYVYYLFGDGALQPAKEDFNPVSVAELLGRSLQEGDADHEWLGVQLTPELVAVESDLKPVELVVQVAWGRAYAIACGSLFFSPSSDGWACRCRMPATDDVLAFLEAGTGRMFMKRREREKWCEYLRPYVGNVAFLAEHLATRLGAPWLQVDFFAPPPGLDHWPVVLSEVRYDSLFQNFKSDEVASNLDDLKSLLNRSDQLDRAELREIVRGGWAARGNDAKFVNGSEIFKELGCTIKEMDTAAKQYASISCGVGGKSTKWWGRFQDTLISVSPVSMQGQHV